MKNYNEAAALLDPPCQPLTWTSVLQAATLANFDLLWDARKDICTLPWTEPSHGEAMSLYFSIKHAHKEIQCLNVEIHRLLTFMIDDHADFYHAISNILLSTHHWLPTSHMNGNNEMKQTPTLLTVYTRQAS